MWGFGTVIKSTHPKIEEGERIYGYLAPTRYLLLPVSPNEVNKFAFYVPRPHMPAGEHSDFNTLNSDVQSFSQTEDRITKFSGAIRIHNTHFPPKT